MPVPRRPDGGSGETELLLGIKVCLLGQILQLFQQQVQIQIFNILNSGNAMPMFTFKE